MPKLHHHHLAQEQQGFTSLVISLTLVLVLALLVVGFGQLTRREQQDALNKQLSTQAYYAAETGINDAVADINASPAPTLPKTNCSPNGTDDANGWHKTQANQIDKTLGVSYSCLLVNLNTPNMVYNTVNPDDDKTALFQTNDVNDNPVNLSDLTIHWGSTDGHTSYPTTATADADKFLPTGDWNSAAKHYPGVIRLAITPLGDAANTNAATPLTRAQLASNTFTVFLYPTSSPSTSTSTVTYLAGNAGGNVVYADCTSATAEYNCTATISGLGATNSNRFLIHFLDLYDTSNISIDGDSTDSATPPVTQQAYFSGAQAMIDSTGKARDVLKRLQVRIPLRESTEQSNYTIEAQNICKRFDVYLDNYNNDNSAGAAKTACNLTGVTWPVGPVDPGPTPPVACTRYAPNIVGNSTFDPTADGGKYNPNPSGDSPYTASSAGYSTELPYRGENTYPDDHGQNGPMLGWYGGYSLEKDYIGVDTSGTIEPSSYTGALGVQSYSFPGDTTRTTYDPATGKTSTIPANPWFWYSNPDQYIESGKYGGEPGYDINYNGYFKGTIWQTTVSGLSPGQNYSFSAYFTDLYVGTVPESGLPPDVELDINGVTSPLDVNGVASPDAKVPQTDVPRQPDTPWQWVGTSFTANAAGQATLTIKDLDGTRYDDDFGMTTVGLYKCITTSAPAASAPAQYSTTVPGVAVSTPPTDGYDFNSYVVNTTPGETATNTSKCVWTWDDGQTTTLEPTDAGCAVDTAIQHDMYGLVDPATLPLHRYAHAISSSDAANWCRSYNVKLQVYYTDGSIGTYDQSIHFPYGTYNGVSC